MMPDHLCAFIVLHDDIDGDGWHLFHRYNAGKHSEVITNTEFSLYRYMDG